MVPWFIRDVKSINYMSSIDNKTNFYCMGKFITPFMAHHSSRYNMGTLSWTHICIVHVVIDCVCIMFTWLT